MKKAGALVGRVGRNVFVKHMEDVIDDEKAETNAGMAKFVRLIDLGVTDCGVVYVCMCVCVSVGV